MPNDYWDMDDKNAPNLLNLASVSTSMLVPFPVGKLPDASVLWLNERWFHDLGIAIHDKPTRTSISASLLERFAVTSLEAHCVAGSFGGRTLGADRYGGSGGAIHGGVAAVAPMACSSPKEPAPRHWSPRPMIGHTPMAVSIFTMPFARQSPARSSTQNSPRGSAHRCHH